ncbi:hypothetical protein PPL_08671 [Heterostelium album PN500]|uniref:Transmembrane 9 superfamily member n=1 Tax=Heterostelium pallidum (strain ATCC 26659 / Pp 5 / PN500) TaxID=670386 RepID=D3BJE6_HETP5|nr:hypothetical protein PPL_08671 [Heterostelium album PN500]EFA78026.1 hypothetical protein PPL_08671 [Heterostelium album PN500]|eukprot:XP_020430154.1 hypothetical protein PPL_08671 [Heterostelium album PN500]
MLDYQKIAISLQAVRHDVFRTPKNPMILSSLVGGGFQLFITVLITLILSNIIPPYSNSGSLHSNLLYCFLFTGIISGYTSKRVYQSMSAKNNGLKFDIQFSFLVSILFSYYILFMLSVSNSVGATNTPSFKNMVVCFVIWIFVHTPMVFIGLFIANKQPYPEIPIQPSASPHIYPSTLFVGAVALYHTFLMYSIINNWNWRVYEMNTGTIVFFILYQYFISSLYHISFDDSTLKFYYFAVTGFRSLIIYFLNSSISYLSSYLFVRVLYSKKYLGGKPLFREESGFNEGLKESSEIAYKWSLLIGAISSLDVFYHHSKSMVIEEQSKLITSLEDMQSRLKAILNLHCSPPTIDMLKVKFNSYSHTETTESDLSTHLSKTTITSNNVDSCCSSCEDGDDSGCCGGTLNKIKYNIFEWSWIIFEFFQF